MNNKTIRIIEFSILYILLPILAFIFRVKIKYFVIPAIGIAGISSFLYLWFYKDFKKEKFLAFEKVKIVLKKIILRFAVGAIIISLIVALFSPEEIFSLVTGNFEIWLLVIFFYPLLSVTTQEIFFRVFFFYRYQDIFTNPVILIIANAFAFGMWHLIFGNWVAPLLSTIGGYLFARTYHESDSLIAVIIEHAIWGDFLLTIGLGYYFYSGAI